LASQDYSFDECANEDNAFPAFCSQAYVLAREALPHKVRRIEMIKDFRAVRAMALSAAPLASTGGGEVAAWFVHERKQHVAAVVIGRVE
jgi:hypothetical protein